MCAGAAPSCMAPRRARASAGSIRAVISEIMLTIDRQARTCGVLIAWQGTAATAVTVALPRRGAGAITTGEDTLDLVRRLAAQYSDTTIAQILGRQQRRTATGLAWTRDRVSSLRRSRGIPHCPVPAPDVSGSRQDGVMASVPQAAQLLGVDKTTIYRWLRDGFITGEQLTPGAPWQVRIDRQLRERIQPDVPDGWLPLDQAAKVLGVARQTVLQKVHRGQVNAVYVTSGRRKGLRIQVEHHQPGLFDAPHERKGAVLTMTDFSGDDAQAAGGDEPAEPGDGFLAGGGGEQGGDGDVLGERHAGEAVVRLQVRDHAGSFPPARARSAGRLRGLAIRWRR